MVRDVRVNRDCGMDSTLRQKSMLKKAKAEEAKKKAAKKVNLNWITQAACGDVNVNVNVQRVQRVHTRMPNETAFVRH